MPLAVEDYRPQRIAQDIHQLVAHLGYDRVTLVAHDWSGAIAWNLLTWWWGLPSSSSHALIGGFAGAAVAKAAARQAAQAARAGDAGRLRVRIMAYAASVSEMLLIGGDGPALDYWRDENAPVGLLPKA